MKLHVSGNHILQWSELEECGRSAFDIWVDQPELNWAQEAWNLLIGQGLGAYANDLQKCRVKIRFLALAGIYHDWCNVAWQEAVSPAYSEWASHLDLTAFRVGQLVGTDNIQTDDASEDLLAVGLKKLISAHRVEVFSGLLRGYGDISDLFVALWNSNKVDRSLDNEDTEDDEYGEFGESYKETADEILNFDMDEKGPAYTWLDQGAEELLDSSEHNYTVQRYRRPNLIETS